MRGGDMRIDQNSIKEGLKLITRHTNYSDIHEVEFSYGSRQIVERWSTARKIIKRKLKQLRLKWRRK